jgi:cell division protein FtsL
MKSTYNNIEDKIKKYFGPKNIILMILIFSAILLIGFVFRYINLQNIQYQKLNEEIKPNIEQQSQKKEDKVRINDLGSPESNKQKQEVEREYREDTLMIF